MEMEMEMEMEMTMTDIKMLNIAEKIREMQDWDNKCDLGPWNDEMETRYSNMEDEVIDALEAAGVLVFGDVSWFPHPDWFDKIPELGLSPEDTETVIEFIQDRWPDSIEWLNAIERTGIERATTALAKRAKQKGFVFEQPDQNLSTVDERGGAIYVVLRNVNGELARFEATPRWNEDGGHPGFKLRYVDPEQQIEVAA